MIGASFILIQALFFESMDSLTSWNVTSLHSSNSIIGLERNSTFSPSASCSIKNASSNKKNRFEAQSLCLFRHVVVVDLQEFLAMGDLTKPASEPSCSLGPFDVNTASTWPQSHQFIFSYMYLVQASSQIQTSRYFEVKGFLLPVSPALTLGPKCNLNPTSDMKAMWLRDSSSELCFGSMVSPMHQWRRFCPNEDCSGQTSGVKVVMMNAGNPTQRPWVLQWLLVACIRIRKIKQMYVIEPRSQVGPREGVKHININVCAFWHRHQLQKPSK